MRTATAVVWHRGDLRLHDNPAVASARVRHKVLGLVVLDPRILEPTLPRRRAWFAANVHALADRYRRAGGHLVLRRGLPEALVPEVANEAKATAVYAVASHTPYGRWRDEATAKAVAVPMHLTAGAYVHEPGTIVKPDGTPYSVFTPFFKRWSQTDRPRVAPTPRRLPSPRAAPGSDAIGREETHVQLPEAGEGAARTRLSRFLRDGIGPYETARDVLAVHGTSGISPYLAVGALSPRFAAHAADRLGAPARPWIRQLAWRDFMADLLHHHPNMVHAALDARWDRMRWRRSHKDFAAWAKGATGVPLVDAGMRQLAQTGRMHNRVRMVAAQFLSKHLLLSWRWGERHFKHHLIDADTAQNVGNWQWAAGLGVDAAPYFRVLSPVRQAQRFDPDGTYLRHWVPESDGDPTPTSDAIVDLSEARTRYLEIAGAVARSQQGRASK